MNENEFGGIVFDCAIKIAMPLGPGLLERLYEAMLFDDFSEVLMKYTISRIINGKLE